MLFVLLFVAVVAILSIWITENPFHCCLRFVVHPFFHSLVVRFVWNVLMLVNLVIRDWIAFGHPNYDFQVEKPRRTFDTVTI